MRHLFPLTACLICLLSSCDSFQNITNHSKPQYLLRPDARRANSNEVVSSGYWDKPEHLTGTHRIVVDTAQQEAKYYIGGVQVGYSTVSTGKGTNATPRGTYSVLSKDEDHRSSKYGHVEDAHGNTLIADFTLGKDKMPAGGKYVGASMFYGLQLNYKGIWMHEGLVTSAPESHGCIRLPKKMAQIFFENVPKGTKVIVK